MKWSSLVRKYNHKKPNLNVNVTFAREDAGEAEGTFFFWYHYTLNSLTLFWLAESVQWIFEIIARDVITADYTIIMSRTLKVTCYHVMYDRSAWFPLRVIMSSSRALCCFPSVKKQKHDFHSFFVQCIITQLLDSIFVIWSQKPHPINICYLPPGRSVLGKTVPEVLSTVLKSACL